MPGKSTILTSNKNVNKSKNKNQENTTGKKNDNIPAKDKNPDDLEIQ